jgi:hypothetical protein
MATGKGRPAPRPAPQFFDVRDAEEDDDRVPTAAEAADMEDGDPFQGADAAPSKVPQAKKTPAKKSAASHSDLVNLDDDRKMTKKAKARVSEWHDESTHDKAADGYWQGQVESARKQFGHAAVMLGDEAEKLVICTPMYGGHGPDAAKYPGCLGAEFVIGQDGFPLGHVIQFVALTGVGKSALLAEVGRWFRLAKGGLSLKEAEDKFNPRWYKAIMGLVAFRRMPLYRCSSIEDWQRKLTQAIKSNKRAMRGTKEEPGPGRTFPVVYGVDSIMGKQSESTMEQIFGKKTKTGEDGDSGVGHASRGHPIEAQIITRYMRSVPSRLTGWPFALVLVNHLRMKNDDMGNPERSKTGGVQVDFQESFEIELKKLGGHKKRIETKAFEGFSIQLSCEKNSFGTGHRSINTRLIWWYEPATDKKGGEKWRQVAVWDWDWSTVWLIDHLLNGERANPMLRKSLQDSGFHLEVLARGDADNRAWSKTLGMTKADAVSWSEVGALVRETPKVQDQLREALFINKRPRLTGDYAKQMDALSEELP